MTEFKKIRKLEELRRLAQRRLNVVLLYMMRNMDADKFVRKYNAGDLSRLLLEDTGPISVRDLDRWANICMGVAE